MTSIFPPTKIGYPYVIEQRQHYDGTRLVSYFKDKVSYDNRTLTISYTRCMPDKSLMSVTFDMHEALYVDKGQEYDDNVLREADSVMEQYIDQKHVAPIKTGEHDVDGFKVWIALNIDSCIRNQYIVQARKMFGSDRKTHNLPNIDIDLPYVDAMRFIKDALKQIPQHAQINP